MYRFHGFPIYEDLQITLDISSFTINLMQEKNDKNVFVFDVFELIKEVGVYSFSFKNEEVEIEIDTSLYIELNNGFTFLFYDVHDRKLDQFYYFRKEEIDKIDIFKTFYYEESRFIDWNKKSIMSF